MTLPQYVGCDALSASDGSDVTIGVVLRLKIDGGAWKDPNNTAAHSEDSWWEVELDAAERNGDLVRVKATGTGVISQTRAFTRLPITQQEAADAARITPTGTVNTNSVDDKLNTILSAIADTVNEEFTSATGSATVGTETGTAANTQTRDGTEWVITSVAAGIDADHIFNVGTPGQTPSVVAIWGRFQSGQNRQLQLQAYNFDQAAYENIGTPLQDSSTNGELAAVLGGLYVRNGQAGTPGVDGDVRIKYIYDTTVSNKVNAGDELHLDKVSTFANGETITDAQIIEAIVNSNPNRNYPDSAIVIDTENGQPGTKFGDNGTPGNKSSNEADALTLAAEGGYTTFIIRGNTTLTLSQAYASWRFVLDGTATIDLNGQDVDNCVVIGGKLTGTGLAASSGIRVTNTVLSGVTAQGTFIACTLPQVDSLIANGTNVRLFGCYSDLPGAVNPSIDGAGLAGLTLSVLGYKGGVNVGGLANDAEVSLNVSGSWQLTDAATTADVISSDTARLIGNLPTGINLTQVARIALDQQFPADLVASQGVDLTGANLFQGDGLGNSQYTPVALAQAPTGSGGLTTQDVQEMRHRLGLTDTKADPGAITASLWSVDVTTLIENATGLRYTQKALEQAPSGGGSDPGVIAAAVWDEARAGHVAVGSFGEGVASVVAPVTVGTNNDKTGYSIAGTKNVLDDLNDLDAAAVKAQAAQALVDIDLDHLLAVATGIPALTADTYLDQIMRPAGAPAYDRDQDSLKAIRDRGDAAWTTGAGSDPDVIAAAVWDEARAGHVAVGSFGEGVASVVAPVTVGTNNDKTGYSIAGTKNVLDDLNDLDAAQVKAEVVEALSVDTYAEPAAVPPATTSIVDKLGWAAALSRNLIVQTPVDQTLMADDGSTPIAVSPITDDGTTTTRGEYA